MDARQPEKWFFVALLAAALFAACLILAPYLGVLVLAGTIAFLFEPVYGKMLRGLRYESLAALATVILVVLIIFIPIGFFSVRILSEAT